MKKIGILLFALSIMVIVTGCAETDLIGKVAKTSFEALTTELKDNVVAVENPTGYELISPEGQRFLISGAPESGVEDLKFSLNAAPFIAAGLDPTKLGEGYGYDDSSNTLYVTSDLGDQPLSGGKSAGVNGVFEGIVATYRDRVGYHTKLDHYGIGFGNGNMFEWAKDMSTNDKDMVFILNPELLQAAGVDPSKVEGWVYTKVEVLDENQKPIEVDKLLQFYDLK
jgi:hypothetical protein